MTISLRSVLSILIVIPLLDGCGKQVGDADKFKQALQSYYDGHPECIALPIDFPNGRPFGAADPWRKQVEALVEAGLLSPPAPNASGQYSLTAAGETAIRKGLDSFLGGMTLCFAQRKIIKVTSFTPPAEIMGVKASRVTYEFELRDIAPWAKAESFQDAFPEIKATLTTPNRTDTEGVVLTSEGWVDEHMVR